MGALIRECPANSRYEMAKQEAGLQLQAFDGY
jgi:hypothetical protein